MVVALDIHIFFDKSVVNRVVEGACLYKKERGLHGVGATLFLWLLVYVGGQAVIPQPFLRRSFRLRLFLPPCFQIR